MEGPALEGKKPGIETSSGGIVYRMTDGRAEIVLIETADDDSRWTFPKGHVEPGESLVETAVREVAEETGLEARVLRKLGEIQYTFYSSKISGRVLKTVHYFLMRPAGGALTAPCPKVARAEWASIEEALKRVHYDNERKVIDMADKAIRHAEHITESEKEQ